jgi:hypothetical protein
MLLSCTVTTTKASAMTICGSKAVEYSDETYWGDRDAGHPVLLIDEATDAITEAVYRIRSGSVLDDRDLSAARVALTDLVGGLGQLAELLITSLRGCVQAISAPGVAGAGAPVGAPAPAPTTA